MSASHIQFYKRNSLFKRVLLFTAAAAGLHALWDTQYGAIGVVALDFSIMAWMLLLFYMNIKGFLAFSRYGYLLSASVILLCYGTLVPRENGVNPIPRLSCGVVHFVAELRLIPAADAAQQYNWPA